MNFLLDREMSSACVKNVLISSHNNALRVGIMVDVVALEQVFFF